MKRQGGEGAEPAVAIPRYLLERLDEDEDEDEEEEEQKLLKPVFVSKGVCRVVCHA